MYTSQCTSISIIYIYLGIRLPVLFISIKCRLEKLTSCFDPFQPHLFSYIAAVEIKSYSIEFKLKPKKASAKAKIFFFFSIQIIPTQIIQNR